MRSKLKACGDLSREEAGLRCVGTIRAGWREIGWGTAVASLQSVSLKLVARMSDHRGAAAAITLKLDHK